jgi:prepilin-type N-terminal cleavage/methylation domain-containing protein
MHKHIRSRQTGFTIVELLIVIVVIAILAAITIVAYIGIQERAQAGKTIAQASAYIKGLKAWEADLGRPTTASCIVPAASISGTTCTSSEAWNSNTPYDAAFNQSLAKYSGVATPQLGSYGTSNPVGQMWYHPDFYGDRRGVLFYTVGPTSECGLSNVLSPNPAYDNLTLMNAKYTQRLTTHTRCVIEVFTY